jgi:hypothetical protein
MVTGLERPAIFHLELVLKGRPRRDDEVKSSNQTMPKHGPLEVSTLTLAAEFSKTEPYEVTP